MAIAVSNRDISANLGQLGIPDMGLGGLSAITRHRNA